MVKERLANIGEQLSHVQVQGTKNQIEEMVTEYVVQCEKAISSGKREDLPKILITKLNEQKRVRQDQALAKTEQFTANDGRSDCLRRAPRQQVHLHL